MDDATRKWTWNASDELAVQQGCRFVPRRGELVCEFIENFCRLSRGRWAGQPLKLMDWQRDFLMRLFGWRQADGRRRFRRCYVEVAKKNGKSSLLSALGAYLLLADNEPGAEIYLNAVDRDQAGIIFDEAARMIQADPHLRRKADVVPSRKVVLAGNSRLVANSAEAPKLDGLNPSAVICDEIHRWPNRALWDVFEYSMKARLEPLWLSLTTAGDEESGIWFEQREYSEKVEAGIIPDIHHLGVIYRASPDDDIDDPETWRKANPALGGILDPEDFRRDLEEAKLIPAKLSNFKRLRLNIIARSAAKAIRMEDWDACDEPPWLGGNRPVFMGLDLSSVNDLSALVWLCGTPSEGFDVGAKFWLPEGNIVELEHQHQQPYRTWADMGLIELTPGRAVDHDFIEDQVVRLAAEMGLAKLAVDPHEAKQLCARLAEHHGLPVAFVRQGFLSLSSPTKQLLGLVANRALRHGGNPILRWHASNVVSQTDPAGNIKFSKNRSAGKIDGMAATVNALAAFAEGEPEEVPEPALILI